MHTCAWCGKTIPDDVEVWGFGAKARADVDLSEVRGQIIDLALVTADKSVPAIVAAADSQARKAGNDFMFMLCSEECASALRTALIQDDRFIDSINSFN